MDARELADEYLEGGLPQDRWRDRLEGAGVADDDIDEVLKDAYEHVGEYHAWVDEELGLDEYESPGDDRELLGPVVLGVLAGGLIFMIWWKFGGRVKWFG